MSISYRIHFILIAEVLVLYRKISRPEVLKLFSCSTQLRTKSRKKKQLIYQQIIPGSVVQSVKCLATDVNLTADPGVASSIPDRSHTFVEIEHEIISTVIFCPSAESFKKGCCQLQEKVCARSTG